MDFYRHFSSSAALGVLFASGAAYSFYQIIKSSNLSKPTSQALPKVSESTLLEVLEEVTRGVEKVAEEVSDALKLFKESSAHADSSRTSQLDMEAQGRAVVQRALSGAQTQALSSRVLDVSDLEYSTEYYTTGIGRSRAVVEAVKTLKQAVGRYFLTKSTCLRILRKSLEIQASSIRDSLNTAWNRGIIKSHTQVQRFLANPSIQASMKQGVEKYFLEESGLTADELQEFSTNPRFEEVRVFVALAKFLHPYLPHPLPFFANITL